MRKSPETLHMQDTVQHALQKKVQNWGLRTQYILYTLALRRFSQFLRRMAHSTKRSSGLSAEQKRLFRAAMIYLGYTRETWAAEHGISTGYLDQVRGGFQFSDHVVEMVLNTISRFRRAMAAEQELSA